MGRCGLISHNPLVANDRHLSDNPTYQELTHKAVFGMAVLNALIGYLKRAVSGFGPIIELSTFFHPLHLDAVS